VFDLLVKERDRLEKSSFGIAPCQILSPEHKGR
jgi:hypothetical protein